MYILAIAEGMSVLAIEIAGARGVAIYYGNSLQVWSGVIGITICGMAAGYYTGGYLSAGHKKENSLFTFALIASLYTALIPGWGDLILKMTMILGYRTGAILSTLLVIFPGMALLGAIPPLIISCISDGSPEKTGKTTGIVFTLSTTGGIASALLTGFFLIPSAGIRNTFYLIALLLIIFPVTWFFTRKTIISIIGSAIFLVLVLTGIIGMGLKHKSHIIIRHKSDGLLGQMIVADDNNTQRRSMLVNSISQTYMHIPTGRSQWRYVYRLALYLSYKPAGSRVLVCGIGGGNLIRELHRTGFAVDAVDIDPRTGKLAREFFGMEDTTVVYIDDARHYIRRCEKKYDIVILDLSLGEVQPSNIYTAECFSEIKKMLLPEGVIIIHYLNSIAGEDAIAVKSIGNTLLSAGFETKLINTDRVTKDGKKMNWEIPAEVMFFASNNPVDLNGFEFARRDTFVDPFNFPVLRNIFIENYDFSDGIVLTDDKPVMDIIHANTLESTRQSSLNELIPILIREKVKLL